jgi:hypothetical protein
MIFRCQPIYTADAYGRNGCRFTVLADGRLTIDGVTGEVDIGVNEFASRQRRLYARCFRLRRECESRLSEKACNRPLGFDNAGSS